jgi:hypothetical protein
MFRSTSVNLKPFYLLAVAAIATTALPSAFARTNQIPALQRQLGQVTESRFGFAAVNTILNAYRQTARRNPLQAAALLRITNARLNRFVRPAQRQAVALSLSQITSAAFIAGRVPASSPLYLQTFPFIATTIPANQRTPFVLNQIVNAAASANAAVGGDSALDVPVTDAILGNAGAVPPPVS